MRRRAKPDSVRHSRSRSLALISPSFPHLSRRDCVEDDLLRAGRIGVPPTLVVLLLVFGAPIAAGLPLVLAIRTIVVTLAVLYALSRVMPASVFPAQNVP